MVTTPKLVAGWGTPPPPLVRSVSSATSPGLLADTGATSGPAAATLKEPPSSPEPATAITPEILAVKHKQVAPSPPPVRLTSFVGTLKQPTRNDALSGIMCPSASTPNVLDQKEAPSVRTFFVADDLNQPARNKVLLDPPVVVHSKASIPKLPAYRSQQAPPLRSLSAVSLFQSDNMARLDLPNISSCSVSVTSLSKNAGTNFVTPTPPTKSVSLSTFCKTSQDHQAAVAALGQSVLDPDDESTLSIPIVNLAKARNRLYHKNTASPPLDGPVWVLNSHSQSQSQQSDDLELLPPPEIIITPSTPIFPTRKMSPRLGLFPLQRFPELTTQVVVHAQPETRPRRLNPRLTPVKPPLAPSVQHPFSGDEITVASKSSSTITTPPQDKAQGSPPMSSNSSDSSNFERPEIVALKAKCTCKCYPTLGTVEATVPWVHTRHCKMVRVQHALDTSRRGILESAMIQALYRMTGDLGLIAALPARFCVRVLALPSAMPFVSKSTLEYIFSQFAGYRCVMLSPSHRSGFVVFTTDAQCTYARISMKDSFVMCLYGYRVELIDIPSAINLIKGATSESESLCQELGLLFCCSFPDD